MVAFAPHAGIAFDQAKARGSLPPGATRIHHHDHLPQPRPYRSPGVGPTATVGEPGTHSYTYDAMGRRVTKTTNTASGNATIVFVCVTTGMSGGGGQVIAEYALGDDPSDPGVDAIRKYVHGAYVDEPLVMVMEDPIAGEALVYYHRNRQYSILGLTVESGDVIEYYAYTPHGELTILDDTGTPIAASLVDNPYTFTARRLDSETGIYYFRARYFDPSQGRFISRDPLGYVDGMSLYAGYFVPNGVDPSGRDWRSGNKVTAGEYIYLTEYAGANISESNIIRYHPPQPNIPSIVFTELFGQMTTDEQGYQLMRHWFYGNGVPYVKHNDPLWVPYVFNDWKLRKRLLREMKDIVKKFDNGSNTVNRSFHAEIGSIKGGFWNGYDLLHGTNETVGGFEIRGTIELLDPSEYGYVNPLLFADIPNDHKCVYIIRSKMTFNDIFDSNPQAFRLEGPAAAAVAAVSTAKDYKIHISWDQTTLIAPGRDGRWYANAIVSGGHYGSQNSKHNVPRQAHTGAQRRLIDWANLKR